MECTGAGGWAFPRPRVTEMRSTHSGEDVDAQVIPPDPASNVIPSTMLNPGLFVRWGH